MTKSELIIGILAALCIIGIIILAALKINFSFLIPIATTLIGWLVGKKNQEIAKVFKKNKKKK